MKIKYCKLRKHKQLQLKMFRDKWEGPLKFIMEQEKTLIYFYQKLTLESIIHVTITNLNY